MPDLKGKVAIVTGGSRGIGFAIAKEFITKGTKVLICSRNKKELLEAKEKLDPSGKKCFILQADVSKSQDCERLIDQTKLKFGRIDILVNNAGIYGPIGALEVNSLKDWQETIQINLMGVINFCHLVIPIMKKQKGGKIVNITGGAVGSNNPIPFFSAYFTSKIAIVGFSEILAKEVEKYNIQVNCVSPGSFYTAMTKYLISQRRNAGEQMYKQAIQQKKSPNKSFKPLADMIIFLSSDQSNTISGRLFSAKWDQMSEIKKINQESSFYKLRRIDNILFHEK